MAYFTSKLPQRDNVFKERSRFTTLYLIELPRRASAQSAEANVPPARRHGRICLGL